ncbi:MAG: hypothetical protein ACYC7E_13745 [Armatimonadota bacterium]
MSTARVSLLGLLLACAAAMAVALPSNTFDATTAGRLPAQRSLEAFRTRKRAQVQSLQRFRDVLVRKRAISPRTVLPRFDTFIASGTTRATSRGARYGGGALTFAYSGWTTQEQTDLTRFLTIAYPRLVSLYGAPADTRTLTLIKGGVMEGIEGGEYDPVANTLTLEALPVDFTAGDNSQYGLSLLHLILHAFRAPAIIEFDAWEEGMAWAAASVGMTLIYPEFQGGGSFPLIYSFAYLLPLYDMLNQPPLSSASFFPDGGISQMSLWRVGMSLSGWLKVYTENPSFFSAFNQAYYGQYTGNPAVSGDLSTLKSVVAAAVPQVENEAFLLWYDRQYAMKPLATIGTQLYVYPVPLQDSVLMTLYYFRNDLEIVGEETEVTETPLSGAATLDYVSYDQLPLYPEEGNEVIITATGDFPGIGFISPSFYNIGDPAQQRIRIRTSIPGLAPVITYFPYDVRGPDLNENQFFGVTVGADDGTLQINVPNLTIPNLSVVQGSFSYQLPFGDMTAFAKATFIYTAADQSQQTLYRNVGPGFYVPILVVGSETQASLTHTFAPGLSLVSFPITPTEPDAGVLFGYGPNSTDLQFAWYDPDINDYRLYPATPPIVPGRGFWVKLPSLVTANVAGIIPSPDYPYAVTLAAGWNLIGNVFNAAQDPWTMTIESGAVRYRLIDAITQQVVGPIWTYDTVGGSCELSNSLQPWEGAWIYNNSGGPLALVQTPAGRMAGRAARNVPATRNLPASDDFVRRFNLGGWSLAMRASLGRSRDASTYLGIASTARREVDGLDWVKPPAVGNGGVRAAFVNPGAPAAGAVYATDIRNAVGIGGESWTLQVSSRERGQVTLSWPNLRGVPPQYEIVLEDLAGGALRYMRTAPSYQFQANGTPQAPDVRTFRITVRGRDAAANLKILSMTVAPLRGAAGLSVNATLSADADLALEVRTTTGRLVRTLAAPATRGMTPALLTWNGRDNAGRIMPSGPYLLRLKAQTPTGYSVTRTSLGVLKQ